MWHSGKVRTWMPTFHIREPELSLSSSSHFNFLLMGALGEIRCKVLTQVPNKNLGDLDRILGSCLKDGPDLVIMGIQGVNKCPLCLSNKAENR